MTTEKATQCPVCKRGKAFWDKYCSEKCAAAASPALSLVKDVAEDTRASLEVGVESFLAMERIRTLSSLQLGFLLFCHATTAAVRPTGGAWHTYYSLARRGLLEWHQAGGVVVTPLGRRFIGKLTLSIEHRDMLRSLYHFTGGRAA